MRRAFAAVSREADLPEGTVSALEERLIVPTLVETAAPDQDVLVTGRMIGVDFAEEPAVDFDDKKD